MKTSENKDKIQYHWIDLSRRLHNSFFLRIDFFKGKLMFRYLGVRSSGFNWNSVNCLILVQPNIVIKLFY